MRLLATYPTPDGPRQLITVEVPGADCSLSLIDVAADEPITEDVTVVDYDLEDEGEAWGIALDYLEASWRTNGRPERCDVFDADLAVATADPELLDPIDYLPIVMRESV
jgi:hypothetical protein